LGSESCGTGGVGGAVGTVGLSSSQAASRSTLSSGRTFIFIFDLLGRERRSNRCSSPRQRAKDVPANARLLALKTQDFAAEAGVRTSNAFDDRTAQSFLGMPYCSRRR
jgi:hypothetical protein